MDDWTYVRHGGATCRRRVQFATPGGPGDPQGPPGIITPWQRRPDRYTAGHGPRWRHCRRCQRGCDGRAQRAPWLTTSPRPDVPGESNAEGQALKKARSARPANGADQRRRGQTASDMVKILPKKARKTVTVKKTKQRVARRTGNAPRKTRIRVDHLRRQSGYPTTTWVRTWRVR